MKLLPPSELIGKLHPHESDAIERYVPSKDREECDCLTDDAAFWTACGCKAGLKRKRQNSGYLVQLCQHFTEQLQVDEAEVEECGIRAVIIHFATWLSPVEEPIRLVFRRFPHLCARVAAKFYWDLERRTTTLCELAAPDLLPQLHEVL